MPSQADFYTAITNKISGPLGSLVRLQIARPPPKDADPDTPPERFEVDVVREIPIAQLNGAPTKAAKAAPPDVPCNQSGTGGGNAEKGGGEDRKGAVVVGVGGQEGGVPGDGDAQGMLQQWMAEVCVREWEGSGRGRGRAER